MKNRIYTHFGTRVALAAWLSLATAGALTSCGSDDALVDINIPAIDDDADCCDLETEAIVLQYEEDLHLVYSAPASDDRFVLNLYTKADTLRSGYNEIYYTVTKAASGRHVKDVAITEVVPLMTMGAMGMKHSSPVGEIIQEQSFLPLYRTWISFVMPSSEGNTWALSFHYVIKDSIEGQVADIPITVKALSGGASWIKSFKLGDATYYLSLVNPTDWSTGTNTLKAYLSKLPADKTRPYPLAADDSFTVAIHPTMPDMGNHTSPNNVDLTPRGQSGLYQGSVNFTMTGRWDIHFSVLDNEGNVLLAPDDNGDGLSDLYWAVDI